jgi:putative flippase GtrA
MLKSALTSVTKHPETRRFVKFGLVGVVNTTLDMGVYILLSTGFHVHYVVANIFAFMVAGINSYYLNRRWTFRSTADNWRREMVKYLIVIGTGFLINEALLYILVEHGSLGKIMAKLVVVAVVLVWNFGVNRLWTFRRALPQ